VDVTRAYGDPQARVGAEYRTGRVALRAGFTSAGGAVLGVGLGGFDVAFGGRVPLEVSRRLNF
jgi:hypothetical protein